MLSVVLNKMSAKTHLVVLNSKTCLNRGSNYSPFLMPRNQITANEIKTRVEKIKNELYWEEHKYGSEARGLAHKYLNMVLDAIDEYSL